MVWPIHFEASFSWSVCCVTNFGCSAGLAAAVSAGLASSVAAGA